MLYVNRFLENQGHAAHPRLDAGLDGLGRFAAAHCQFSADAAATPDLAKNHPGDIAAGIPTHLLPNDLFGFGHAVAAVPHFHYAPFCRTRHTGAKHRQRWRRFASWRHWRQLCGQRHRRADSVGNRFLAQPHRHTQSGHLLAANQYQFFTLTNSKNLCGTSPGCVGLVQFLYQSDVTTGYLKIVYVVERSSSCPLVCFPAAAQAYVPILPANAQMSITAQSISGMDSVILYNGNQAYALVNPSYYTELPQLWQDVEFNLFGISSVAPVATFSPGSSVTVKASINNGTLNAPSCSMKAYTTESNNLYFNSPCCPYPGASDGTLPSIVFSEGSNPGIASPSCSFLGASVTPNYTVTAGVSGSGSISPSGAVTAISGTSKTFTLTPSTGYQASIYAGSGSANSNSCGGTLSGNTYTTQPIYANCTVTALFSPIVTASAGAGGSISPAGSVAVASGTTKTYTVTPNAYYNIASVGGTCTGTLNGNTYTTKAITAPCTVTAAFKPQTYIITASAGTGGAINPSGYLTVNGGATQAFTVTPTAGYRISSVNGCGKTNSLGTTGPTVATSYSFGPITASCTVTAAFTPITYTVTSNAGTGGAISPAGAATVNYNATKSYTVTPNAGYRISSVNGCSKTNSLGTTGPTVATSYSFGPITASCTVTAAFTPQTYIITTNAGTGGSINPSGYLTVSGGTTKAFTVTSNAGYAINTVNICGKQLTYMPTASSGSSTVTTSPITTSCTVSATFTPIYTVTANAGIGGMISPTGSLPTIPGTAKTFTVTPSTGYSISSMGGTCGGTLSNGTYTTKAITTNCTVTAAFTPSTTAYAVTTNVVNGGSPGMFGTISPLGPVSVLTGATKAFVITPNAGWKISFVTGCGGTLNGNTYTTGPIIANCTISVTFAWFYTVTANTNTGGAIIPSGPVAVIPGSTQSFTIMPNAGYAVSSVGSTCSSGTLSGNTYTIKAVTANCTVTAAFIK
jgi:hypothetical protein